MCVVLKYTNDAVENKQVSISSTFYEQRLHLKITKAQKTDTLTVNFVLLGSALVKASHKMLVKSTPGVNFINYEQLCAKRFTLILLGMG